MKSKILFTLFFIISITQTVYSSTSAPIKIIVTIVNEDDSIFEQVDKNVYHAVIQNFSNTEITFNSETNIQSFPRKKKIKTL